MMRHAVIRYVMRVGHVYGPDERGVARVHVGPRETVIVVDRALAARMTLLQG
jgi:hypothetical protein